MKIFKFPSSKSKVLEHDPNNYLTLTKDRHCEKPYINKSPTSHFKKSGSLDITSLYSSTLEKNKLLERVYRAMSSDKKNRNRSNTSSKSTCQLKYANKHSATNYQSSYTKIQNPKKDMLYPQKKIFLKTEKKSRYLHDLRANIEIISEKLQRCLEMKSQKLFLQDYSNTLRISFDLENKQNNDLVSRFINSLQKCQQKKYGIKSQSYTEKVESIEKQRTLLAIEIKKIKIKEQAFAQEMKKIHDRNLELCSELKRMRQKTCQNQFTQTSEQLLNFFQNQANQHNSGKNPEFIKLIQQVRAFKEKQNHMSILLDQLRREGFNIEKIYKKGLKFIQREQKGQQRDSQQQEQGISYAEKDKQQHKSKSKSRELDRNDGQMADNSIIDDIEALSFSYQGKENMENIEGQLAVFPIKREYICQKKMEENLKEKLKLDFNCLYEDQFDSRSQVGKNDFSGGFQTI